jgi:hypothetical protein
MRYALVFMALFLLLLAGSACSPQTAAVSAPVDVQMSLRVESDPPTVGSSTLIISLKDGNNAPIDGAALNVHANMDHEGMMPVEGQGSDSTNGDYHIPLAWTMGGGWIVTVTAQLPNGGGEASETFELFVEAMSSQSIINQPSHGADMEPTSELTAEHEMD